MRLKIVLILIITIFFGLMSLSFLFYPTISNAINTLFNDSKIDSYSENVNSFSEETIEKELSAATEYNRKIAERVSFSYSPYAPIADYDEILNFDDILGYVEVPKINIKLAIYHGTVKDVLTKGAAHLPNTSFPIGGNSTHAVISAHTGYPAQVFFDDLQKLENGDVIYIYILDKRLSYEVISKSIVVPEDTSLLEVEENRDLISLITCYPYGINSHRLIVTASRCDDTSIPELIEDNDNFNWLFIVGIVAVMIFFLFIVIYIIRKKGREDNS